MASRCTQQAPCMHPLTSGMCVHVLNHDAGKGMSTRMRFAGASHPYMGPGGGATTWGLTDAVWLHACIACRSAAPNLPAHGGAEYVWLLAAGSIALDVCTGLRMLHTHGLVHRDLKHENVFLNWSETGLQAMVRAWASA